MQLGTKSLAWQPSRGREPTGMEVLHEKQRNEATSSSPTPPGDLYTPSRLRFEIIRAYLREL